MAAVIGADAVLELLGLLAYAELRAAHGQGSHRGRSVGGGRLALWDLADLGKMLARLTEAHARRMQRLGLTA